MRLQNHLNDYFDPVTKNPSLLKTYFFLRKTTKKKKFIKKIIFIFFG
jgi:hypothetical protein